MKLFIGAIARRAIVQGAQEGMAVWCYAMNTGYDLCSEKKSSLEWQTGKQEFIPPSLYLCSSL